MDQKIAWLYVTANFEKQFVKEIILYDVSQVKTCVKLEFENKTIWKV